MLSDLYAGAYFDALARKELVSSAELEALALSIAPALNPMRFLSDERYIRVIAEIKRASPSKGVIAAIENAGELADSYARGGAGAVSVLTEGRKFLGTLADLAEVRSRVEVPVLRKDFISTEYQILEARAHGADLVLLIAAGLDAVTLSRLKSFTEELGMSVLLETHNRAEVMLACELESQFIGVNARNLETFETDRSLFGDLVGLIPKTSLRIAESAIRGDDDVKDYALYGADCVLVGECLVSGDAESLVRSFSAVEKV